MKYRMVGSSSSVGMDQLTAIHVYSNGYKILEVPEAEFKVDDTAFDPEIPVKFTPEELSDKWVRIRPRDASAFQISFSDQTPKKMFEPRLTPDSLASRRKGTIGESREAGARLQGAQEHAGRVP